MLNWVRYLRAWIHTIAYLSILVQNSTAQVAALDADKLPYIKNDSREICGSNQ